MNAKRKNMRFRPIAILLMASVIALSTASAFGYDVGDFSYSYNLSTKEGTLTGYKGSSSHVAIPSSFTVAETYKDDDGETHTRHHTITVTAIGSSVFANKTFIKSFSFHKKLKSIGSSAFSGCTGLTEVDIDGTALNLSGATGLFSECSNLRRVSFGDGVTALPNYGYSYYDGPFVGCTNLVEVSVGSGVTKVPTSFLNANYGNKKPKPGKVSFAGEISSVGSRSLCISSITNLEISLAVGCTVESSAFSWCPGVNERNIDFSRIASVGDSAFSGCVNIRGAVSLGRVASVSSSAFYGCAGITSVGFSESLTSIGQSAFSGCVALASVRTPASLTSLGSSAFSGCTGLTEVDIDGTALNLSGATGLFSECSNLRRVSFGDGVTALPNYGYSYYDGPFVGCTNLVEVSVGSGVTKVPTSFLNANYGNKKPKPGKVSFAGEISSVGSRSLCISSITNLEISLAVGCTVESSAFSWCPGVNERNIDFSRIASVGDSAFSGCVNIRGAVSLGRVASVSSSAFYGCAGITSVGFSESLTSIGQSAFYNCTNAFTFAFAGTPPSVGSSVFKNVKSGAVGTYTAAHAVEWEAVIDDRGYWNGLKMKPSYYMVIYDANNGTGARTTATVEWGEPTPAGDGTFTWEAHYFMGWAFEDVGGSTLGSNDVIPEPQEGNTVTLYGQWATFEPVAADWGSGSITLKATGVAAKEDELVWLSYCDANAGDVNWEYVDNSNPISIDDGQSISVTDTNFSSRLGGIPPVKYRFQIGKSLNEIRATMSCTTRTKRGIFVGVGEFGGDYQTKPKPLPSAPTDARKLRDLMENQGQMAENNLLTNSDATYENVDRAFSDFADKVKPGDICLVYFSTHGGVFNGDTTIGTLCLYNKPSETDDPKRVGYHEALLANHIRMLDPENKGVAVVNIISACHSGAFFDDSNEEMCSPASSWCHKENLSPVNVAWFTAASYKATAYSYFDHFLIHYGWDEGWADIDNARVVSFLALANYTKRQYDGLFSGIVFEDETESKQAQIVNGPLLGKIIAGTCVAHSAKDSPSKPLNVQANQGKARDSIIIRWDSSSDAREYCIFYRFGEKNSDGEVNQYIGIRNSITASCDFKVTRENEHDPDEYEDFLATTQNWPALFVVKAINGSGISEASIEANGWVNALLRKVVFNGNGGAIPNSWDGTPISGSQLQVSTWVLQGEKLWIVPTADKAGFTLCGWFNGSDAAMPETVIQNDVTYTAKWTDMTSEYLSAHPKIAAASGNNIATAATMTAANGCRTVGECYALGIDPEDPNDDLKITDFKIEDGKPVITLNHTKDDSGNSFESRIRTLGKANLTDADWVDVTDKDKSAYHFFKVTVDLP